MGNREQFSCRLDQGTIEKLKYLHDTWEKGYGELVDFAIRLLWKLDDRYPIDKDMVETMRYMMEDFYL